MKIVHTSDINSGKKCTGLKLAGDKLRAGLKTVLSRIVDYTINEKADMLVIAGNLFDNLEISNNLQNYIIGEFGRLESIPVVIVPGDNDKCADSLFWNGWENHNRHKNIFVIENPKNPYRTFEELNCTVYGMFPGFMDSQDGESLKMTRQDSEYHIAIAPLQFDAVKSLIENSGQEFDYIALGGKVGFEDISETGRSLAYSGSPEQTDFDQDEAGYLTTIEIDSQKNVSISKSQIGQYKWQTEEIKANEILSNDDLVERIERIADENTALRLKLSGLALFETDLAPARIEEKMQDDFLWFEIIDDMKVLPENVSEVKVSEKTLLGQYIKVMAGDLGEAEAELKPRLEKSLKIGYALLQGREIW
ncbi:MAG: hypothetical protein GY839_06840 [candidate division Zixibacteria bacterium]|nr:hypothetical protein [candidate division Zixibacteria bacterium]